MGFYNERGRVTNDGRTFNGFEFCPITGESVIDSNFVSPVTVYDGYEYILLNINPNVTIGLESHLLNDEDAYTALRKHSDKIIQLIKDCKKSFFEMDSILLNELEKSGQ